MPRVTGGLRAIAVLEALKGTLALLAAFGVLAIIPKGARHIAVELIGRLHLNAGKNYPNVFRKALEDTANTQLWVIAALGRMAGRRKRRDLRAVRAL
jgi:hypothetical protein